MIHLAAVFLVLGYVLIRRGNRNAHRAAMLTALVCSVLFLASYLTYHYLAGSTRFPGTGSARTIYLSILLTHTVLAAAVPFLAGITVYRAFRGRFAKHRAIVRVKGSFTSIRNHDSLRKPVIGASPCHPSACSLS